MKTTYDLNAYLDILRRQNQLVEIKSSVDRHFEIGSILANLESSNMGAGYFTSVKDADFPLVGNLLGSMERIALALDCSKDRINEVIAYGYDHPIPPVIVESAPCYKNILQGDDVDLYRLPIPQHAPKDGGPFITGGVVVSADPETGVQNLSFQRMQVKGKNKLGIMINEWRHLRDYFEKAEAQGHSLPVSVVIGADPAIYICAGLRCDGDEMEMAGALRKQPLEVVKSITSDIRIPACAEIVIEGEILPFEREMEGPLSEFTGHYSTAWESPVLHVKAIAWRDNAIYQTVCPGLAEHMYLGSVIPREPLLMRHARYVSKQVQNVHIPPYGSGFLALIQIRKKNPGEPKNLALAAMMTYVNIKNVIVVDEDVDIFSPSDVLWALSNRVIPEKDIFTIRGAQGHELDPGSDLRGVQTKMGIDATLCSEYENRDYERAVYPKINLTDYVK
ncbi:MAG: UbiD family decarboxylase [Bacillota bacterium]